MYKKTNYHDSLSTNNRVLINIYTKYKNKYNNLIKLTKFLSEKIDKISINILHEKNDLIRESKILNNYTIDKKGFISILDNIQSRLMTHLRLFELSTMDKFINAQNKNLSHEKKTLMLKEFIFILEKNNFDQNLKKIYQELVSILNFLSFNNSIKEVIEKYQNLFNEPINITDIKITENEDECCGKKMLLHQERSELICGSCSKVKLVSTSVTTDQYNPMEGQRNMQSKYQCEKHCRDILEYLYGKKEPKISQDKVEKIIEAVKKNDSIIFNKSKNMYRISCETLRQILSDLSKSNTKDPLTQYNKCIPYIRQLIGGPKIPFISSDDYEHLLEKFIKVISCFIVVQTDSPKNNNIIKGKSKKNRSYYLYFLYKLIDLQFENRPYDREQLLECIHLQSTKTLGTCDKCWREICKKLSLTYRPTIPTIFEID